MVSIWDMKTPVGSQKALTINDKMVAAQVKNNFKLI